jgi:predicted RNase H-like nuclease
MSVVGVDIFRNGWVAVELVSGKVARAHVAEHIGGIVAEFSDSQVICIDIPIGLVAGGYRDCDKQARARLVGRAKSSVFPVAPREVVEIDDYAAACERARALLGKALSKQSFGLHKRILEVDAVAADPRIYEVHPELIFARFAGEPLPSKKSWAGMKARLDVLAGVGIEIPSDLGVASAVPPDDILDAAASAVAAERIARGAGRAVPDVPTQRDVTSGRAIQIWY